MSVRTCVSTSFSVSSVLSSIRARFADDEPAKVVLTLAESAAHRSMQWQTSSQYFHVFDFAKDIDFTFLTLRNAHGICWYMYLEQHDMVMRSVHLRARC